MEINNIQKQFISKIYQLEKMCYHDEFLSTSEINSYISDFPKNGWVIIDDEFMIGYALVIIDNDEIELRLGVHEQYRKLKHGTRLLSKVKGKLNHSKTILKSWVPETNLDGQLFLQHHGFICSKTEQSHYKRKKTNGYLFIYRYEWGLSEKNGLYIPEELSVDIEAI